MSCVVCLILKSPIWTLWVSSVQLKGLSRVHPDIRKANQASLKWTCSESSASF